MTSRSELDAGVASAAPALELAARWPVLPLNGKVPLTAHGLKDATTDPITVRRWFTRIWPAANVGVRTGDGLLVVDVDGDTGADTMHRLQRQHAELPRTVSVCTGGGGTHYYFACNAPVPNSAGKLGAGVDIRCTGGYVVAPRSVHPTTGALYEWDVAPDEMALAPAPPWLLSLLSSGPSARRPAPTSDWVRITRGPATGQRNHDLARLTGYLLHRDVDERVAAELVHAVNERSRPPLPAGEVDRIVASIAGRAIRRIAA